MRELAGETDPPDEIASAHDLLSWMGRAVGDAIKRAQPHRLVSPTPSDVISAMSTAELSRRPSRPPDYAAENRALIALAQKLAISPNGILQELADTALSLCRAHSSGLSLLEDEDNRQNFHWRAISGEWASHLGGGTPRNFGPCGTVLDRNVPLLFSHPERDFPYFAKVTPLLEEALLVPFYLGGEAVGTIWVVMHDEKRRFETEDLRVLTSLGTFAAAAYQSVRSLKSAKNASHELQQTAAEMQRFAFIVESSDDAIVSKDLDGTITSWNKGAEYIFGYTTEEIIGKSIRTLMMPDRYEEEELILQRLRRGERVEPFETIRRRKDGSLIHVSVTVSPIRNAEGRIIGASKIGRDITERKRAQERHELIVSEMKHRIKNTLATIQAIATQTLSHHAERDAFIARLHALDNAHELLTSETFDRTPLHTIVSRVLAPFQDQHRERILITEGAANLCLDSGKSAMVAMAIHELATNAVKYGALSNDGGRVSVSWEPHVQTNGVQLFWRESGGPEVSPPKQKGFGSQLIERVFGGQCGQATLLFDPGGLSCRLEIRA